MTKTFDTTTIIQTGIVLTADNSPIFSPTYTVNNINSSVSLEILYGYASITGSLPLAAAQYATDGIWPLYAAPSVVVVTDGTLDTVTCNPTTNVLTTASADVVTNGTAVCLYASPGTAPTGLSLNKAYYVVNAQAGTGNFQLATSLGGSAIDFSSAGTGTLSICEVRRATLPGIVQRGLSRVVFETTGELQILSARVVVPK